MGIIELRGVGKTYLGGTTAVSDVDLEVGDGEFVVFVGPSGCGKTTLLRMIAGLEDITTGTISINGQVTNHIRPRDRDIAMVFQNYALYPQMTVAQNIGFGLKQRKIRKDEIQRRVNEVAKSLELSELLDKKPKQLSGGQRQRVAMGRAIVRHPQVFLLDEPLSNLDAKLRVQMRAELGQLHERLGVTTLYVTHDQTEAMTLGQRIAVFAYGRLQQYDAPRALYDRPKNLFVAGFIGSPSMNIFDAVVHARTQGGIALKIGRWKLDVSSSRLKSVIGDRVLVGIRPEDLSWTPSSGAQVGFTARVELVEHASPDCFIILAPEDPEIHMGLSGGEREASSSELGASLQQNLITMRLRPEGAPAKGQIVNIQGDLNKLHMFDCITGESLTKE